MPQEPREGSPVHISHLQSLPSLMTCLHSCFLIYTGWDTHVPASGPLPFHPLPSAGIAPSLQVRPHEDLAPPDNHLPSLALQHPASFLTHRLLLLRALRFLCPPARVHVRCLFVTLLFNYPSPPLYVSWLLYYCLSRAQNSA